MNVKELKEIINKLPDDMVVKSSRWYDKKLVPSDIIVYNNEVTFF